MTVKKAHINEHAYTYKERDRRNRQRDKKEIERENVGMWVGVRDGGVRERVHVLRERVSVCV